MSITGFLSVLGGALGVLGLLAGAVAYLAAIRQRTTIDVLSKDNEVLRHRVDTVEDLEQECKQRLLAAETSVRVLTDTVTNTQAIAELLSKVDGHRALVEALEAKVEANFREVKLLLGSAK